MPWELTSLKLRTIRLLVLYSFFDESYTDKHTILIHVPKIVRWVLTSFALTWCRLQGSNLWPARYECAALPTELNRLIGAGPPRQKRKTSKNVPMGDKWASIRWKALINDMSFFHEQTFWERLFRARGRWSHVFRRSGWLSPNVVD